MKKSLLLIIALFYFLSSLISQINETSVWNYHEIELGEPNRKNILNIEKDTLIDGKTYFIVNRQCNCTSLPRQIIRQESGKMYYYYKSQEYLFYDFEMKVGDTISIYWPISDLENTSSPITVDSIYYVVDSMEVLYFEGMPIKKFYIRGFAQDQFVNFNYSFGRIIYENIGANCLFPIGGDWICEVETINVLCYEQDSMIYHLNSFNCELTGVEGAVVYTPFVDEKGLWIINEILGLGQGIKSYKASFSPDTFLYGNHYYHHLAISEMIDGIFDYSSGIPMREEERKVYRYKDDQDFLIFDFNLNQGDTFSPEGYENSEGYSVEISRVDTIRMLNNTFRRQYNLECEEGRRVGEMIEGIGSLRHFYSTEYLCAVDIEVRISCYFYNGRKVYAFDDNKPCWLSTSLEEEEMNYVIFPNPVLDFLTIHDLVFEKYEIYDITGVKVLTGGFVERVDFRALPKGVFFVNLINSDRENIVTRVVKL